MSKTAKSKKGFQNKTGEDDGNSFMINGAGLMERTNVESKRSKLSSHWGGARDPGVVDIGQTEYITRLTALRDSLIDQEQLYLAQALDRLRIHSLTNKNSSYRLRMNGDEVVKSPSTTQRKNMVSTVEKFRQMRPKRQSPVILPLQGKPLLEKNAHGRPASEDITATVTVGSLTNRSLTESNVGEISSRSAPSKIDESVQSNLQRLIQPTSSIPNIGRKALKHQENLELKTRSFQNMRSRVYRNTGRQLASPFLPIHEVMAANVPFPAFTSPILAQHNSSNLNVPQRNASVNGHAKQDTNNTHRQEGGLQSDAVDIDQTEEYLLENYLDTSRPQSYDRPRGSLGDEGKEGGQSSEGGRRGSVTRTPNSSQSKRRPHRKFPPYRQGRFRKHNTTDREAFTDGVNGNGSSKSYSYSVHKIANGYRNGVVTSFDYSNDSSTNYLSDTSYSTSVPNGYYLSTGEESDVETTDYNGTKLPAIHQGEGLLHSMPFPNRSNKFYRKMKSSHQSSPVEIDLTLRPASVVVIPSADDEEGETVNECEDGIENNHSGDRLGSLTTKKHIVVDMPSIVFNSPSPTSLQSDMDNGTGQGQISSQVQGRNPNTSLRKTLKQQEIRRRELSNLVEDVKELNMRTEALSSQSLNDLDGVDE